MDTVSAIIIRMEDTRQIWSEVVDEVEPQDGTQIISNNFIDDMDKGNYMTLAPAEDGGSEAQGN